MGIPESGIWLVSKEEGKLILSERGEWELDHIKTLYNDIGLHIKLRILYYILEWEVNGGFYA